MKNLSFGFFGGGEPANDFFRSGTAASLAKPDGTNDTSKNISRTGMIGVGINDPSTVVAHLDIAGGVVFRPVLLANFAANSVIGTPAATVDVAAEISIAQTTTEITLSAPNPTSLQAGRLLTIKNRGTVPFLFSTLAGNQKVYPNSALQLFFSGAGWMPAKIAPYLVPIQFAGNLTLLGVSHHFEILECTSAANVTVTVPSSLPVGFQVSLTQVGAGEMTFVGSGGMVVSNRWGATQSAGVWAKVGIEVRATNSAVLSGDVI